MRKILIVKVCNGEAEPVILDHWIAIKASPDSWAIVDQ